MDDDSLDWLGGLPVVMAIARSGSATSAAQELAVSPATALRQLARVEVALGLHLFDRTPAGMVKTEGFARLVPLLEQVEASAHAVVREAARLESWPEGIVRLASLPGLTTRFITDWMPALREGHPGIELHLLPSSVTLDLIRREADLAVRLNRPTAGDLVAQRVYGGTTRVVGSRALLERLRPRSLADLPWITWERTGRRYPETQWLEAAVPDAQVVMRSSDLETQLRAAEAGVGVLLVSEGLASSTAGLVSVALPGHELPEVSLWLVAHRALRSVPRVDAVWSWLVDHFSRLTPPPLPVFDPS